jgi:hypothetical protein
VTYQALSPHQIEEKLRTCITDLTKSEGLLATARNDEVAAEQEYEAAHRRAMLSPDCPKVERGHVTVADRDAWVNEQCEAEHQAYRLAAVALQAAQDHQRTVRDVTSTVQTIASLCKAALSLAGHS